MIAAFLPTQEKLVIAIVLMLMTQMVYADSLRALLMPGPVASAHKKFEQDCHTCHDTSNKEQQGQLCMDCHSHANIKYDVTHKTGFHGRLQHDQVSNCKHCHTDHKGRNTKIILFNPSSFNHNKTDFRLTGKHSELQCAMCHAKGKKYSEAPDRCYSCHKKDDVHNGKQGENCNKCHNTSHWKRTSFDHDKTLFPLTGAHKSTSCDSCHINQQYKDTPVECNSCHKIQDIHKGKYGNKCSSCHTTSKWNRVIFDHNRKTGFPLLGAHKSISCNNCHSNGDLKKPVPKQCYGCHKNDDIHKGRFGKKCNQCHTSNQWSKSKFNHDKTRFPLLGAHTQLLCADCHTTGLKTKLGIECNSCHRKDDVHKGKLGKQCNNCHNEDAWNKNVKFDHDLSSFPLIGMHAVTACDECHVSTTYGSTPTKCNDCHAGDDVHKTKLGTDCQTCHNPNSWKTWLFDHNKLTSFRIDGAHKKLGCYDCHNTPSKGKLKSSSECISCHRRDDIHNGQFGNDCARCHTTKDFREININR